MKRLLPLAVSAALAACTCGPGVEGGAHRVILTVDDIVEATAGDVEESIRVAHGSILRDQVSEAARRRWRHRGARRA